MDQLNGFKTEQIYGWSKTNHSEALVFRPQTVSDIVTIVSQAQRMGKKILGRGAGQSYGDQSLNGNNLVIDLTGLDQIINWNPETGVLQAEAGVTFAQTLSYCLKDNWVLPVIPGTRYVTLGGAVANNIHGKNSYHQGNFGQWVKEFKIILANGENLTCSSNSNHELFNSVISGTGLLGIVTEITIQLIKTPSPYLEVTAFTKPNFLALMNKLDKEAQKSSFVIAQVDCFARDGSLGRGTVHSADFITKSTEPEEIADFSKISPLLFGLIPKTIIPTIGRWFLCDTLMKMVSGLKYHFDKLSSGKFTTENIFQFTFLLDKLPNWQKVFRNGFFEYQTLIPRQRAREVIPKLISLTHQYRMPAYLSAIKIHQHDDFTLSFALDGYSLALDIPNYPKRKGEQTELFRMMNELVIEAGGTIYLAKDAVLTPEEFKRMYPKLDHFKMLKQKYDPSELFQSDMYRRIFKKDVSR